MAETEGASGLEDLILNLWIVRSGDDSPTLIVLRIGLHGRTVVRFVLVTVCQCDKVLIFGIAISILQSEAIFNVVNIGIAIAVC